MINFYADPLTRSIIGLALAIISYGLFIAGIFLIELMFATWRKYRHNRDS